MKAFITGTSCISPQRTVEGLQALNNPIDYPGSALSCYEPNYENHFTLQQLRRLSRVLKIGTTTARLALADADLQLPDGIITGTGYGCLEDTITFLRKITELKEQALNPTPFMQSTHNTIGSTVAIMLQCTRYNQTFVHGAFSFEQSLIDALLFLAEQPQQKLLVGAIDERTSTSQTIFNRFGIYRKNLASSLSLFKQRKNGTIGGEGAAYFVLTGEASEKSKACIEAVRTIQTTDHQKLHHTLTDFLSNAALAPGDVDLLLLGKSGDKKADQFLDEVSQQFTRSSIGVFKHLCGEHPSATSFATWMAVNILAENHIPETVFLTNRGRAPKNILLVNSYLYKHHTFILLTACHPTKK